MMGGRRRRGGGKEEEDLILRLRTHDPLLLPLRFSMMNAMREEDWQWYFGTSRLGHIV